MIDQFYLILFSHLVKINLRVDMDWDVQPCYSFMIHYQAKTKKCKLFSLKVHINKNHPPPNKKIFPKHPFSSLDVGTMLSDLTDELDAMLKLEKDD